MRRHMQYGLLFVVLCSFLVACGGGGGGSGVGTTPSPKLLDGAIYPPSSPRNVTTIKYIGIDNISLDMEAIEGQVVVLFEFSLQEETARNIIGKYSGKIIGAFPRIRFYLIEVSIGTEMNFIGKIRQESGVLFAFLNFPLTPAAVQVSPNEWGAYKNASNINMYWYLWEIRAPYAWGSINKSLVKYKDIGIVEPSYTGLDSGLYDFQGRIVDMPKITPATTYENHGSWVTALAAASGNNGRGNVGVNWWSKVRFASVLFSYQALDFFPAVLSIGGMIDDGAKVINFSISVNPWGEDGICSPSEYKIKKLTDLFLFKLVSMINESNAEFKKILNEERDYIFVKAAGNDNCEHDGILTSTFKPENLIIVGASGNNHGKASFSDYGENWVDIAAPGENIGLIDYASGNTITKKGTSLSAPLVTGAASLLWSFEPNLTPKEVIDRLKTTARPFAPGTYPEGKFGAGILDVYKAMGGMDMHLPLPYWARSFGLPQPQPINTNWVNFLTDIQQTNNDKYIVVGGDSWPEFTGGVEMHGHIWILQLNSDGSVAWQKYYLTLSGAHDELMSFQTTSDGGLVATGWTYDNLLDDTNDRDRLSVMKLSVTGSIDWAKNFIVSDEVNGPMAFGTSIKQTSDGGYIVAAGSVYSDGVFVVKLSSTGAIVWQKFYQAGQSWINASDVKSIVQTMDGGYIILATESNNFPSKSTLILKINPDGSIAWQKKYGSGDNNMGSLDIKQTKDKGYIVTGYNISLTDPGTIVIKLNESGIINWQKLYYYSGGAGNTVQQASDGGYIMATDYGISTDVGYSSWGGITKLNSDGTVSWTKEYQIDNCVFGSVQQTSDSGFIVGGMVVGKGVLVVKLDANGNIIFNSYPSASIKDSNVSTVDINIPTSDMQFNIADTNGYFIDANWNIVDTDANIHVYSQ